MSLIFIYRHFLSLNCNEMRTDLIIAYINMRLILYIGIYVIKYQHNCPFQRMGGRLLINLVSNVGTYSKVDAYLMGRLIEALLVLVL